MGRLGGEGRGNEDCASSGPRRAPCRLAALPGRFEIIYNGEGQPVDRLDREAGTGQVRNGLTWPQACATRPAEGVSREKHDSN